MTALCLCGAVPDPAIACDCGATFCSVNHRGEHRQGGCPMLSPDGTLSITKRAKSLVALPPHISVPPVRMAWHDDGAHAQFHNDPAPSLAEKARLDATTMAMYRDDPGMFEGDFIAIRPAEYARLKAAAENAVGFLVTGDHCDRCGDTNYDEQTRVCLSCTYPTHPSSAQPLLHRLADAAKAAAARSVPTVVTVPVGEYERLMAVVEAARAWRDELLASVEKTGKSANLLLTEGEWQPRLMDVWAAVDALDKEAGDDGQH